MKIINVMTMINNLDLPQLTALGVDKRELFLKVFECAVEAQNLPHRNLVWDKIYKMMDDLPLWDSFELTALVEYLLDYISFFKKRHHIPEEIKLKLTITLSNKVACFARLDMCAKRTSEIYQQQMAEYEEELLSVLDEPEVIENPTAEDMEKINV